jgi:hypothetical protein
MMGINDCGAIGRMIGRGNRSTLRKNAVFWYVSRVTLVRTDVSEERRFSQGPYGVISQKTAFFIVTAVKT